MIPKDYFEYPLNININFDHISVHAIIPYKSVTSNEVYDLDEIILEIAQLYRTQPRKIIFSNPYEGFVVRHMKIIYKVAEKLIHEHKIPHDQLIYVVGALPVVSNIENYKKICAREKFHKIKILLANNMERDVATYLRENKFTFNSSTNIKIKKFISMNGVPRMHRIYFSMLLIDRNLLDLGHYSFQLNDNGYKNIKFKVPSNCPGILSKCSRILESNLEKFPMFLTKKFEEKNWFNKNDIDFFNESRFNIVQETLYFNDEDTENSDSFNYSETIFITEKTWRSMAFSIPFVMLNRPFSLKALKEYGYKTFHPYINESYDDIEDDENRMLAVLNEVERLCKLTDKEWYDIHTKLLPILKHNFDKIFSTESFTLMES